MVARRGRTFDRLMSCQSVHLEPRASVLSLSLGPEGSWGGDSPETVADGDCDGATPRPRGEWPVSCSDWLGAPSRGARTRYRPLKRLLGIGILDTILSERGLDTRAAL